jgi:hypothetical protein
MTMTRNTRRWIVGGTLGSLALAFGYGYLHRRRDHEASMPHGHGKPKKHKHHDENARGEYGHKKHHHKELEHGG